MLGVGGFGGNGQRGNRRNGPDFPPASIVSQPRMPKDNSPEGRAVKGFTNALNTLTFKPDLFAWFIAREHIAIQKRALACLIAVIDILSARFDNGHHDTDEEFQFYVECKRAQDAMAVFRNNGML